MNTHSAAPARNTKMMNRFDLTSRLVAKLKNEEAVIGGIGNTNFDLWAAGHRPQNFYMLGSMGLACPIALGVALAQPQAAGVRAGGRRLAADAARLPVDDRDAAPQPRHGGDGQWRLPDHRRAADAAPLRRRHRGGRARLAAWPTAPGPPTRRISSV